MIRCALLLQKVCRKKILKNKRIGRGQGLEVWKLYFILFVLSGQINVDLYVPAHKGGNRDHTTTYINKVFECRGLRCISFGDYISNSVLPNSLRIFFLHNNQFYRLIITDYKVDEISTRS